MTPMPLETILVAAAASLVSLAVIVFAYVVLSRRSDSSLDRLRTKFESDSAPHYAEISRSYRAKLAERNSAVQDRPTTESTTP